MADGKLQRREGGPDSADVGAFKGIRTIAKEFHPFFFFLFKCVLSILVLHYIYIKNMYAIELAHPELRALRHQIFLKDYGLMISA